MKNYLFITLLLLLISINLPAENRLIFYHGNYGMINEFMELDLQRGLNQYRHEDVPAGMIANTVMLLPERRDAFLVQTQGFLTEARHFQNFLTDQRDKEIEIITKDGSIISGYLFYFDRDLIGLHDTERDLRNFIRIAEIRNYILHSEDFSYRSSPIMTWDIRAERAGKYPAQLTYLTGGLGWSGIYKAIWDGSMLNLDILANITNSTGVDYKDFRISLVAGDPKRISQRTYVGARGSNLAHESMDMAAAPSMAAPEFVSEELGEYYIYSYTAPIDLLHSETKQIRLYPPKRIEPEVYYEYFTNSKNLLIRLKIINDEKSGLGMPLPQGTLQIYRPSEDDKGLNFVGEDRVEQRPVNEEWIISPGVAFDLVGETTILATRRPTRNVTENDMQVKIRNRSKERRSVVVTHNIRNNWLLQRQNHDHEQVDSNTIRFRKELQPDEEYIITWTERIEY